ncbi:hypothetical protein ACN28E_01470 [Archangium lansingense]|uniref:hypothetical protein n=1 Tax=Archangium lansingense TaxID=2995310 RepID=UPI003B79780E
MTKQSPKWFFAPLGGGEESGLNESGIETFKRSHSLGRETCQNMLDHRDNSGRPCIAVFEHLDLPASDIPGRQELEKIFTACRNHVLNLLSNGTGNEKKFFETALSLLAAKSIPTLRIGDENTTGLTGDDEDRKRPFWRLLKGQGFSSLEGVGGGTYGIGQRAPFAHSALRTIMYATKLPDGKEAFTAKAILASHPAPFTDGNPMTQSKGWYCHPPPASGESWSALREPSEIPARYRRSAVGTDLYVLGYTAQDWEQRVRHAILENFFSAIDQGHLEVQLKENGKLLTRITRDNLEEKLFEASEEARESQLPAEWKKGLGATPYYLKALRSPFNGAPYTKNIDGLGEVKLFIYRDLKASDIPERWACMRSPRMIVESHGSGLLSRFAGVVLCDTEPGNKVLALMEDPTHSRWHEDEARNWSTEERAKGREMRLALANFVAETLKKIRNEGMPPSQDVPFLGRYLPSEADPDQEAAVGAANVASGGASVDETGHKTTKAGSGTVSGQARKAKASASVRVLGTAGSGVASVEGSGGGGASEGVVGGTGGNTSGGGEGGGGEGGGGEGGGGGGEGGGGGGEGGGGGGEGGGGGGEGGGGGGEGGGGGGGAGGQGISGGPGESPGGRVTGGSNASGKSKVIAADAVRFRSYASKDRYRVILESKRDVVGDIELQAVGEDSTYPVKILSATDVTTGEVLSVSGTRILGLSLSAGKTRKIDVAVDANVSVCLGLGG